MKISTITCHDVYNHGASLQAYALMTFLIQKGHDVEIIDYKPDYLSGHYKFFRVDSPKWKSSFFSKIIYLLIKFPGRVFGLRRKRSFDYFKKKHLVLSSIRFTSNGELKQNPPHADAFICGSDQIWNCNLPNGHDSAFYLDFAPTGTIKISYAASLAMDEIPEHLKEKLRQRISFLDHVSVRESDAVNMLHDIGLKFVTHVLDPVFLLNREAWDDMVTNTAKGKYILVYSFGNKEVVSTIAKKLSKDRNCPVYAVNSTIMYSADKNFHTASPNEFLGLIKNAECVVTNSFHAIAFSLIFKVDFVALGRTEKLNSRMINLLENFGLTGRYFSGQDVSELPEIDYDSIDKEINERRAVSVNYLENALSGSKAN